jgi:hypothetical protein
MKVKAIRPGYYGDKKRRVGDEFELENTKQFSSLWMESLEEAPQTKGRKKPEEPKKEN